MTRVALVVMPFAAEDGPALGVSLLRAGLLKAGIECDVMYLNLTFAAMMGLAPYRAIDSMTSLLLGEWIFAPSLFDEGLPDPEEYAAVVLGQSGFPVDGLMKLRADAKLFIEHVRKTIFWEQYDVVGFSSSFQQNIASLALANWIRHDHPEIKIIMGGANCEGVMGEELLASFPFLDAISSGEADHSIIQLIKEYAAGRSGIGVPGVSIREANSIRPNSVPEPVKDLDSLPFPDFDDFYRQFAVSGLDLSPGRTHLKAETARGCWWGERAHCTFCGLNGVTMAFRRKSTARCIEEFERLLRYPSRSVIMTDNILDEHAFEGFLPVLAEKNSGNAGLRLFYEIKSSLTREQVSLLSRAGVRTLQPGIESLSTDVLGRMRKGTRAIDNVALLKWATEDDVALIWNLLCGFPGEKSDDHIAMAELIPALSHLQPPTGLYEVQIHRFSPFHNDPTGRGIGPIAPAKAYRHIYPFDDTRLNQLAYFFERVAPAPRAQTIESMAAAVTQWRQDASEGTRVLFSGQGAGPSGDSKEGLHIRDTRSVAIEERLVLDGLERQIMAACDQSVRHEDLLALVGASAKTDMAIKFLLDRKLLTNLDGRYLALPIKIAVEDGIETEHALDIAAQMHRGRLPALAGYRS